MASTTVFADSIVEAFMRRKGDSQLTGFISKLKGMTVLMTVEDITSAVADFDSDRVALHKTDMTEAQRADFLKAAAKVLELRTKEAAKATGSAGTASPAKAKTSKPVRKDKATKPVSFKHTITVSKRTYVQTYVCTTCYSPIEDNFTNIPYKACCACFDKPKGKKAKHYHEDDESASDATEEADVAKGGEEEDEEEVQMNQDTR
jgi:hypothetical protein